MKPLLLVIPVALMLLLGLTAARYNEKRKAIASIPALQRSLDEFRSADKLSSPKVTSIIWSGGMKSPNPNSVMVILNSRYEQLSNTQQMNARHKLFSTWVEIAHKYHLSDKKVEMRIRDFKQRDLGIYTE